jgi:hypothetical protein
MGIKSSSWTYFQVIGGIRKLKQKKKQKKAPKKLPDFSLEDILNAPKPKAPGKSADGLGCTNCGSLRFISRGEIKVFRGQRMKVCHCCGQEFYKAE